MRFRSDHNQRHQRYDYDQTGRLLTILNDNHIVKTFKYAGIPKLRSDFVVSCESPYSKVDSVVVLSGEVASVGIINYNSLEPVTISSTGNLRLSYEAGQTSGAVAVFSKKIRSTMSSGEGAYVNDNGSPEIAGDSIGEVTLTTSSGQSRTIKIFQTGVEPLKFIMSDRYYFFQRYISQDGAFITNGIDQTLKYSYDLTGKLQVFGLTPVKSNSVSPRSVWDELSLEYDRYYSEDSHFYMTGSANGYVIEFSNYDHISITNETSGGKAPDKIAEGKYMIYKGDNKIAVSSVNPPQNTMKYWGEIHPTKGSFSFIITIP